MRRIIARFRTTAPTPRSAPATRLLAPAIPAVILVALAAGCGSTADTPTTPEPTGAQRIVSLARKCGHPVHVLHISTAEEMDFLAGHKDIATVEATPQHLTLAAPDCYEEIGTLAQMNPPIREARHRDGLWAALQSGIVDVIGSDHAPHTRKEKSERYPRSPSGMPGVQTLVPIMLDHVNAGRLTLERFVDLTSAGPQRLYDIAGKGRLAVGYDADFTVVDMSAKRRIEDRWIASKSGWSPYDGRTVTGWPVATIIRGSIVMREDELLARPIGQPIRFIDTLPGERAR